MIDIKQMTYSFKYQLKDQHNFHSADLKRKYKTHIFALDKTNTVKEKEIGKLSSIIF